MINISKKLLTIVAMTMTMATNSVAADTLTVAMTGDIMMGTLFPTPVLPPEDGKKLFVDVKDILLNENTNIIVAIIKNSFLSSKSTVWVIIRYIFSFSYYILPREK